MSHKVQLLNGSNYIRYLGQSNSRYRKQNDSYKGLREGRHWELFLNGYGVSIQEDEKVLKMNDGSNTYTSIPMYLMPMNCIPKSGSNAKFHAMYICHNKKQEVVKQQIQKIYTQMKLDKEYISKHML